jgi:hypothetical protein
MQEAGKLFYHHVVEILKKHMEKKVEIAELMKRKWESKAHT